MPTTVIAVLSLTPLLLGAGIDYLYSGLRPTRPWLLKTHIGIAILTVPLLLGVLVPIFETLTTTSTGTALLSAGELGLTYGVLVLIWSARTAFESAAPSVFRR